MEVKGVIFDMDGLMFDTERIYYKAWQEAAQALGYAITWEIYTQIVARNSRYIEKVLKQILGEDLPYTALALKKKEICEQIIEEEGISTKPGLLALLDTLEKQGIKKAVATSSGREKALGYLKLAGIEQRFDAIICGNEVEESKPNPEIFLKAAQLIGKKPEECLVLEDSRLGIQAAYRAGMRGIFIPDLVECDEEIKGYAHKVLNSLEEVPFIL